MYERSEHSFVRTEVTSPCENNEESEREKVKILTLSESEIQAGSYFLGPTVHKNPDVPIRQCLARKKWTGDYYLMKILTLDDLNTSEKCSYVTRTGFHNEYSILSLLKDCPGVIKLHDFFKDVVSVDSHEKKCLKRVCMVLECLIPHGHRNSEYVPLSQYLKEETLFEHEILNIFYNLLLVVEDLHKRNIVHGDLKLSNIILNRKTFKVKLIDFQYAKFLTLDNETLQNTFYPSFDGGPEKSLTKSGDVWSAGIVLLSMLNVCTGFPGKLPILNRLLCDHYLKMKEIQLLHCSEGTKKLLSAVFWTRLSIEASEAVEMVSTLIGFHCAKLSQMGPSNCSDQVVPECPDFNSENASGFSPMGKLKLQDLPSGNSLLEPEDELENANQVESNSFKLAEEDTERLLHSTPTVPQQNQLLNSKEIKSAMERLGVTSINSINALSFNYSKSSLRGSHFS